MPRLSIALCLVPLLTLALATTSSAQGKRYSDKDWNTAFKDSCGLPSATSIQPVTVNGDRKLQFTLGRGDKGKCGTDNQARHRAPYWERAELSQTDRLAVGHRYEISAEVQFVSGFTGQREAFMQIHGWDAGCTHAYPPVMLKFNKGELAIETLRGVSKTSSGRHRNAVKKRVRIDTLYGKPGKLVMQFDTRTRPGLLSVSLDGQQLATDAPTGFASCAKLYLKMGVYRPGGKKSGTSSVIFDDVQVRRMD